MATALVPIRHSVTLDVAAVPEDAVAMYAALGWVAIGPWVPPVTFDPARDLISQGQIPVWDAATGRFKAADFPTFTPTGSKIAEFAARGNSLTAQGNANGPKWVDGVAADLGLAAFNDGVAGQGSTEIVIRMGAFDPAISVPNNQLPASGSVTVTMLSDGVWRPQITSWPVLAGGVPWILSHDAGSGSDPLDPDSNVGVFAWKLDRVTPGDVIPFPAGSKVHCTTGDAHRGAVTSIWVLTNNPATDPTIALGLRDVDLAVAYATNAWAVATEHLRTNESQTAAKKQINAILRQRFTRPGQIVDLEAIMGGRAIVLAGLNATAQDQAALALGQSPPSLMSDTGTIKTHFNAAGYQVVRSAWRQAFALQAAVPGLYPALKPEGVGAAAAASAATAGGFTATIPAANARATAYHWDYRKAGTTAWVYGPNTLGLVATFTGLDSGTTYEHRYTPCNIADYGSPSQVGTGTTSGTPPTVLASDAGSGAAVTNINGRSTDQLVTGRPGGSARAYSPQNAFIGKTADGAFYLSNGTGASQAVVDLGVADHSVELTVQAMQTSGSTAIILGYTSATNLLLMVWTATGLIQLRKNVNGAGQQIIWQSADGTVAANGRLKARKAGSTFTVQVNGVDLQPTTDPDIAGFVGTKAGFQVSPGAQLRDFVYADK